MTLRAAANDLKFRCAFSRNLPIARTFHRIPGFPESLCLYKIPASRFWQVRVFFRGRLIIRSTRVEKLELAEDFARRFYCDLDAGHTPPSYRLGAGQVTAHTISSLAIIDEGFEPIARQLLLRETARCERGELAWLSHKADRDELEKVDALRAKSGLNRCIADISESQNSQKVAGCLYPK
jgi:hypothetical protein